MANLKKIHQDLEIISTIGLIANVYQETAHLKMVEIRQNVLKTREFLNELTRIYNFIKKSYFSSQKQTNKKGVREKSSFIAKKQKGVLIFLSVNEIFYGTLILDIWKKIQEYLKKNKNDLVVVGRIGKYLAEGSGLGHKMMYFELNDENPEKETIKNIVELIKNYEKITVFHGKFETVIEQNPAMIDISGGVFLEEEIEGVKKYLFEPSPEAVLGFFETEIVSALFNQTILEHRLARYAARMMSMYQATENAKKMKKGLEETERNLKWQTEDKKQLETFSSFKFWQT